MARIWAPLLLLVGIAAVLGLRYGILRQAISESDVILLYAQKARAAHDGALDCAARPGAGIWVWLVVDCQDRMGRGMRYEVNPMGGLIRQSVLPLRAGPQT